MQPKSRSTITPVVFLIAAAISIANSGCRTNPSPPIQNPPCPPVTSLAPASVEALSYDGGSSATAEAVHVSFDQVESTDPTTGPDDSILDGSDFAEPQFRRVPITLREAMAMAAGYAPVARLIDEQRNALQCRDRDDAANLQSRRSDSIACIDRLLAAKSDEARNQAAANAGELVLQLAGLQLRRSVLDESNAKIAEILSALDAADQNGIATAKPLAEAEAQVSQLKQQRIRLENTQTKLQQQLNVLLGIVEVDRTKFQPIVELIPSNQNLNTQKQIAIALSERNLLQAIDNCCQNAEQLDDVCFDLLSDLDFQIRRGSQLIEQINTLQQGSSTGPLKLGSRRRWWRVLNDYLADDRGSSDSHVEIRKQQAEIIRQGLRALVSQQVVESVSAIQLSYRQIASENQELLRLKRQDEQLEAAAEIDAQTAYVDQVKNWVAMQQLKVRRIEWVVQNEVAKLRLLAAQGQLGKDVQRF